jgi:hypothetical protein
MGLGAGMVIPRASPGAELTIGDKSPSRSEQLLPSELWRNSIHVAVEAAYMATNAKPNYRKTILRLPDLDHAKSAVLNSLTSLGSRRAYRFAIEQFI